MSRAQLEARVARLERLVMLAIQATTVPGYDGCTWRLSESAELTTTERAEMEALEVEVAGP